MFDLAFVVQTAKELWARQFEFQLQFCVRHPNPALSVYHCAPHTGPRALGSPVLQGALNI